MAIDARQIYLETLTYVYATGGVDDARNQLLVRLLRALALEPETARKAAVEARQAAADGPAVTESFSPSGIYVRLCELSFRAGGEPLREPLLETVRTLLGVGESDANGLLAAAREAARRPGRPAAPAPEPEPPPALDPDAIEILAPSGPLDFYRPSGRFELSGVLTMLMGVVPVSIFLGLLYGALNHWIGVVQINALMPLFAGWAIGWIAARSARGARVRSRLAVSAVALAGGAVADYFSFVAWLYLLSRGKLLALLPGDMTLPLEWIVEKGAWSIGSHGEPVRGTWLILAWIAELVLVCGSALTAAYATAGKNVYCEPCGRWVEEPKSVFVQPQAPCEEMCATLAAGDLRGLVGLQHTDPKSELNVRIELAQCSRCKKSQFLSAVWRTIYVVNGTEAWQESVMLDKLCLSVDAFTVLSKRV